MTPRKYDKWPSNPQEKSRHYGTLEAGSEPRQSHTEHNTMFTAPRLSKGFPGEAQEISYTKGKLPGGGSVDEHNPY